MRNTKDILCWGRLSDRWHMGEILDSIPSTAKKKKKSVWLETSASVWKTTEVGEVSQEPERRL